MRCLIDTHFLVWVISASSRLDLFPWFETYRPWGVSPFSFLEIAFLEEVGRLDVDPSFLPTVQRDPRFEIDDISTLPVIRHATTMSWTRDPFDRLIAAHSSARRMPLCSVDETIRRHHSPIVQELAIDAQG